MHGNKYHCHSHLVCTLIVQGVIYQGAKKQKKQKKNKKGSGKTALKFSRVFKSSRAGYQFAEMDLGYDSYQYRSLIRMHYQVGSLPIHALAPMQAFHVRKYVNPRCSWDPKLNLYYS